MFLEHQENVCQHALITSKMKVFYSVQNQFCKGPIPIIKDTFFYYI